MVKLDDKDLYQLLLAEFRYSVKRDNHLAPGTCAQHIMNYLPDMSKQWRAHTAKQLSEEIIDERLWNSCYIDPEFKFEKCVHSFLSETPKRQLDEDCVWEDLLVFLTNYLESLPHNTEKYMKHIRGRMTYSDGIDYYSTEINSKLVENLNKNNVLYK
jgi:hypothetical protein